MRDEQRTPGRGAASIDRDYWRGAADRVAAQGQRVLALAAKPVAS
jgi:hypothetical protein